MATGVDRLALLGRDQLGPRPTDRADQLAAARERVRDQATTLADSGSPT